MTKLIVIAFIFSTLFFLSMYLLQLKKNRAILANTLRLLIIQESANAENKTDKEKTDEAFLKFISDSRDWAYEYIETAQAGIQEFVDSVGSDIDYMDKYRPPVISEESTNRLINSYQRLKTLLPETDK